MKSTIEQQIFTEGEFYQNISKGIPSCVQIIDEIPKFVSALQDAFDDSHSKAKEFLSEKGKIKKVNNQFYPQMMRFLVHNYLEEDGVQNQLVDENDVQINDDIANKKSNLQPNVLASNGIAGVVAEYRYRVLKAIKCRVVKGKLLEAKELTDIVPPPGSYDFKNPKCKFYCQSHLKGYQQYLILPKQYDKPLLKPNVIFLWDVDKNNFIKLYLAIPKWGNGRQVSVYEIVPIKHPAETIISEKISETQLSLDEPITNIMEQNIHDEIENSLRQQNKTSP